MCKVDIIGSGNVATHLLKAFSSKTDVNAVNPRTLEGLRPDADFTIISVSDNAIREVAAVLPPIQGILAHTSGSTPIDAVKRENGRYGVFYPLQTFTKGVELNYSEIPFFIEGSDKKTADSLRHLAGIVSERVDTADSAKRKAMHIASVFACNFTNHLWAIAEKILKENGMDFETVRPLLEETLKKTGRLSPFDAQTGPAVRKDSNIIDSHLEALKSNSRLAEIYRLLSDSIIESHSRQKDSKDKH